MANKANPKPKAKPKKERTYFEKRIFDELGITPEQNRIKLKFDDTIESGTVKNVGYDIFSEDEHGNIRITPFTLDREFIQYDNVKATPTIRNIENSRRKTFYITRLKVPREYKDKKGITRTAKYDLPKGAGTQPMFNPGLCDKFEQKVKIPTLVLTEGYFKAFKGYLHGLDIVGLSSIHHYKQKDTETMYTDVLRIVKNNMVENIVILYDGDARDISLKDLEKKRDLRRRPTGFINSARNVRELFKDYNVDVYFAAINSAEIKGKPKGLDDLYCALSDETDQITKDLTSFSAPTKYFNRLNIRFDLGKLFKWFMLDTVENFQAFHSDVIGTQKFIYSGTEYRYNPDTGKCEIIVPKEAADYFRVGDDYYKYVSIPNKYEQNERKFVKRAKTTITEDHSKRIFRDIPKYEAFCNVPNHENFQPSINNCFNVYAPFEHEPDEGEFETITEFLNHIFGEQIEIGLDYIQLLYQKPTQILPIFCLVSKENNTGKSTFLKLLKAMFTQNCTIIGNSDLNNDFNGFWASKLIVGCEESFIDKKPVIEKIKALSTADKINMNRKGKDQDEIDFFAKFILASNNEDNFILASKNDIRYWVRKISKFKGKEKVHMLQDMMEEIPAFLFFLNKRQMHAKNETRMWFTPEQLKTEALEKLMLNSRTGLEKELYEFLKKIYFEFGDPVVYLTPTVANDLALRQKQTIHYLSRIFNENMKVETFENGKVKAFKIPYWGTDNVNEMVRMEHNFKGRPYVFPVEKILTNTDLKNWNEIHGKEVSPTPEPIPEAPEPVQQKIHLNTGYNNNLKEIEKDLPF